jgi:hypothetical protein
VISLHSLWLAWAWFLVNKGSKFWQENWENHVDRLEDYTIEPLYKIVIHKRKQSLLPIKEQLAISVSKINIYCSAFVFLIWLLLFSYSLFSFFPCIKVTATPYKEIIAIIIVIFVLPFLIYMYGNSLTHYEDKTNNNTDKPYRKLE